MAQGLYRDKLVDLKDADGKVARFYANMNGNEAILDEFFTDKLSMVLSRVLTASSLENMPSQNVLQITSAASSSAPSSAIPGSSLSLPGSSPLTVSQLSSGKGIEARCAEILLKYGQSPTCFDYDQLTNRNIDGQSFFTRSILNGNNLIAETLIKMKANPDLPDETGIPASVWFSLMSSQGSKGQDNMDPNVKLMIDRVTACGKKGFQNKMLTNISNTAGSTMLSLTSQTSAVGQVTMNSIIKMSDGYSNEVPENTVKILQKAGQNQDQQLMGFLEKLKNNKVFPDGKSCLEFIMWEAKIQAISMVAKGETLLQPIHLIALYLYTGNYTIYRNVNMTLAKWDTSGTWHPFISCLYQGIHLLPPFVGECYRTISANNTDAFLNVSTKVDNSSVSYPTSGITTNMFDPELHKIGTRTRWNTFSLCSKDWKDAGDLISNNKKGLVFIIKSKSGRVIAPYSKYPVDNEVIFLPGTEFEITDHYVGKLFALGQANIRKTSYKMKEVDYERVAKKELLVIIELTEVFIP